MYCIHCMISLFLKSYIMFYMTMWFYKYCCEQLSDVTDMWQCDCHAKPITLIPKIKNKKNKIKKKIKRNLGLDFISLVYEHICYDQCLLEKACTRVKGMTIWSAVQHVVSVNTSYSRCCYLTLSLWSPHVLCLMSVLLYYYGLVYIA